MAHRARTVHHKRVASLQIGSNGYQTRLRDSGAFAPMRYFCNY